MAMHRYHVVIRCPDLDPGEGEIWIRASSEREAEARARVICTRAFWGTMGDSAFLMDDGPEAYRRERREWRDHLTIEVYP